MNRQHLPSWVLTAARKVGLTMKADKVLIFGSFARGTQSLKSDLDVFMIADTEDRPLDRIGKVLELLSDVPCGVDAIVYTPAEVERASSKFVDRILKEGVVAYER